MILPEGPRGRWLALGLLIILISVVVRFIGMPAVSWYVAIRADQDDLLVAWQQAQRIAQQLPILQAYLQNQPAYGILDTALWPGDNAALAAANLQHFLQKQVTGQGGRVLSTRVLPAMSESVLEQVSLQITFQINVVGLQALLYALEQHQPRLFIEQLQIQVKPQSRQSILDVRLVLYGLRQPDVASLPAA